MTHWLVQLITTSRLVLIDQGHLRLEWPVDLLSDSQPRATAVYVAPLRACGRKPHLSSLRQLLYLKTRLISCGHYHAPAVANLVTLALVAPHFATLTLHRGMSSGLLGMSSKSSNKSAPTTIRPTTCTREVDHTQHFQLTTPRHYGHSQVNNQQDIGSQPMSVQRQVGGAMYILDMQVTVCRSTHLMCFIHHQ